jgi:hypothetical protein
MNSKYEVPESVVIVSSEDGVTATLRFKTKAKDRILSSPKKDGIYRAIEKYVMGEKRDDNKKTN